MGSITFGEGVTTVPLTIKVNGDTQAENDNTFFVNLSNAVNATFGKVQGVGVIKNDDGPVQTISINDIQRNEGNNGETDFTFTVSRTSGVGTAKFDYVTANGSSQASDLTQQMGSITFGVGVTTVPLTIKVKGDTLAENDNTFFVNLSNAVNATIADGQGVGVIKNDDGPVISPPPPPAVKSTFSIGDLQQNEGNGGQTNFNFIVSRTSGTGTASVKYATAFGTNTTAADLAAQSGTVNFLAGEMSKPVTIKVNGDTQAETDNTFFVNLSSPVNATIGDGQGIGLIKNDDPTSSPQAPTISIDDVTKNEGDAGKTAFTFTVTRSSSAGSSSVKYATAFGSNTSANDMAQQSGLVTFGVGQMGKSITILVNGDTLAETINTFFVNLSEPVNGSVLDAQGVGTILNDD
jgi:serralysin